MAPLRPGGAASPWQSELAISSLQWKRQQLTGWTNDPSQGDCDRQQRRPGQAGWPSGAGGAGSSPAGGALGFGWSDGASGSLHREDGGVGHRKWHSAPSAPWPATGKSGANQLRDCTRSSVRTAPAGGDGPPRPSTVRRSKRVRALAAHVTETAEDRNAAATVTRKANFSFDAR